MSNILVLIGIVVFFLIYNCMLLKQNTSVILSLLLLASSFGLDNYIDYNFISKLSILVTTLLAITKTLKRNNCLILHYKPLILFFILFLIQIISYSSNKTSVYTIVDFIQSSLTIMLGIGMFYIKWDEISRYRGLVMLSWLGLFCVIMGIVANNSLFLSDGRIVSGTSLYHAPGQLASIGIMSSIVLVELYEKNVYRWVIALNFSIVMLTQLRGILIFSLIILIPYIFFKMHKLKKIDILLSFIIIPIIFILFLGALEPIIERTFLNGELNTSGRFEGWTYWIHKTSGSRIFGLGIGSIKTAMDDAIVGNFNAIHNEYLRFIIETGVIGTILISLCLILIWINIYKNCILSKKIYIKFYILAFLVLSFTSNTIAGHTFWIPYALCFSLLMKSNNLKLT